MGLINGIATAVALLTFIGIVWWAFSRGREKANRDSANLPFLQPDEADQVAKQQAAKEAQQEDANKDKKAGGSHE